ncbi:hypothetical protein BS78_03G048900 [Paspalum vaginatum]|nr:hypothetical protein BS78_03G048900 [Paspalum vaginatum]
MSNEVNPSEEDLCLVDSCTTNYILTEIKYFQTLTKKEGNVLTIAGRDALIVGSGRAIITLPMDTQIVIEDALLYPDSTRTLLSYKDIRKNGLHVEIYEQNKEKFLLLTKLTGYGKQICEKILTLDSGLKITNNSIGHDLTDAKLPKSSDYVCTACATGKLILRPSPLKIRAKPLRFLERTQGDICGPIEPSSRPFRYFLVLIDASTRWSHVCLLSI